MGSRKFNLHDGRRGAALGVRVTPRASRNEVTEIQSDGTVKVRLMTTPDGDVNKALVGFMADVLGVPAGKIEIVAGLSGNDKLITVLDIEKDEIHNRLMAYLE